MIRFDKITHKFASGITALDAVDLDIDSGELVFIVGKSGAGKTTLLRLLLRELIPTEGKIFFQDKNIVELKDKDIPKHRQKIGAAFQDFKLLEDRTIAENIGLALQIQNQREEAIEKAMMEALGLVGLEERGEMFPLQLSGGETQRAVIARAMISNPDVLFADEPTGNLDPETSWQIMELLKQINEAGKTVIMATHNANLVDALRERVVRLEKGRVISDEKKGSYQKAKKEKTKKRSKES